MDCVSCSPWDVHANGNCTIPVTLDDLDIDCLLAVIVSYCSLISFFGCVVWFISDLKTWIIILITTRCLVLLQWQFSLSKTWVSLVSQVVRCALFILTGCIFFFLELLLIRKCIEYILKGKRVSFWWSLISRVGFDVQIGAVFLTVSYFLCQFLGSITFLRGLTCHTGKPSASCWSHIFRYR